MLIKYMYIDKITGKCSFVYLFIYSYKDDVHKKKRIRERYK